MTTDPRLKAAKANGLTMGGLLKAWWPIIIVIATVALWLQDRLETPEEKTQRILDVIRLHHDDPRSHPVDPAEFWRRIQSLEVSMRHIENHIGQCDCIRSEP